jgi:hypothetical protein
MTRPEPSVKPLIGWTLIWLKDAPASGVLVAPLTGVSLMTRFGMFPPA